MVPVGLIEKPEQDRKCLTWDFTCINTISDSYILECAKEPGKGAEVAKRKKFRKYDKLLNNYHFIPIAVETFGAWGQEGLKFIKEIGKKITQKTSDKNATNHIIQAISMAVQRGNAASIMGTLGPQRKLDDYFDVVVHERSNH